MPKNLLFFKFDFNSNKTNVFIYLHTLKTTFKRDYIFYCLRFCRRKCARNCHKLCYFSIWYVFYWRYIFHRNRIQAYWKLYHVFWRVWIFKKLSKLFIFKHRWQTKLNFYYMSVTTSVTTKYNLGSVFTHGKDDENVTTEVYSVGVDEDMCCYEDRLSMFKEETLHVMKGMVNANQCSSPLESLPCKNIVKIFIHVQLAM